MTITSETAQSGMVSHEVERDGEDVEIVTRFGAGCQLSERRTCNVTPEHARELAEALLEVSGYSDIAQSIKAYAEWRKATGKVIRDIQKDGPMFVLDGDEWKVSKIEIQPHESGMLVQVNGRLV